MLTPSRRTSTDRPAARGGFGLVELVVAIMILSVGVLGLASTAAYVTRQVNEGGQATYAANRVQTLMDSLRAVPNCSGLASGSIAASLANKRIEQKWTVTPSPSLRSSQIVIAVRWVTPRGNSRWQSFTTNRVC